MGEDWVLETCQKWAGVYEESEERCKRGATDAAYPLQHYFLKCGREVAVRLRQEALAVAVRMRRETRAELAAPRGSVECRHIFRVPHEPASSFGDGSDYQSICVECGASLRDPPTTTRVEP